MRHSVLPFCLLTILAVTCVDPEPAPTYIEVESVTLSQDSAEMVVDETLQLQLTVLPTNATYEKITWASSKNYVASISNDGVITANAEGSATITATAGGKSASCHVKVDKNYVPVSSVTMDQTTLYLFKGKSGVLVANVQPINATNPEVSWTSSDDSIVSVEPNGLVTALKGGSAVISAQAGGKSAVCIVTVNVPVESVSLDRTNMTLDVGGIVTLVATVHPDDATDKTVKWTSSNSPAIAVDGYGNVTAVRLGAAVITASAGGKTASCTVKSEEKEVPVESITLDRKEVSLEEGQTTTLVATVTPKDATDGTVHWSSSDESVATVNEQGFVRAIKQGQSTITARAGAHTATCVVSVLSSVVPVTSVTLDKTELTLEKGQSATITATVNPENATDKNVTWNSSDPSTVSVNNGIVTALKGGTAAITAAAGERSAVCVVTVNVSAQSVTLDRYSLSLTVGEDATLTATVLPSDASDKTVRWSSSDSSIASVDSNGKISALKQGTASITATAGKCSATCEVKVSNIPFVISPVVVYLPGKGGSFSVTATCSAGYHISSKPDWVSETSVKDKVHTFQVAANGEQEERSGVVVFCDDDGVCLPCMVKQAGGGEFSVSPSKVALGAIGGTFEVKVSCSADYHISSKPGWISDISDGTIPQLHKFEATKNTGDSSRSGVIVFCDEKGICIPCSVSQKSEKDGATGGNEGIPGGDPVNW